MELEEKYEKKHRAAIDIALGYIILNFNRISGRIAELLIRHEIKPEDFRFAKNKVINNQLTKILGTFSINFETIVKQAMIANWKLANEKNDIMVREYLASIKEIEKVRYFETNIQAMNAFIKRTEEGMNLSKRVWNLTDDIKLQLKEYVGSGILEGRSAANISIDVRQLLREPDKLFRRVRNEGGKLVLSKPARAYHPGAGVYRSSYKNALRLTATETNMAYRMADYERRQQLDFVMGFRVHLSKSHPRPDICDSMAGDYPKDFVFRGWHPWCLCYTTSILMSGSEYRRMNNGVEVKRMIKKIPVTAKNYLKNNAKVFSKLSTEPYFVTDNKSIRELLIID